LDVNVFPNFTVQTLKVIRVTLRLWKQNDHTILYIHEQAISLFDIQFPARHLWNRDLIRKTSNPAFFKAAMTCCPVSRAIFAIILQL
jgi:hypothetical protein